jgi:hypothetical protein
MEISKRICIVALMVLLAACSQSANDSRAQFCNGLRGLEPSVAQLVEGNDIANAGQLKQSLVLFRDALSAVVGQVSQIPNLNLDNLIQSLDAYETRVRALPNDTPIRQTLTDAREAAGKFKSEYDGVAGAVCAK